MKLIIYLIILIIILISIIFILCYKGYNKGYFTISVGAFLYYRGSLKNRKNFSKAEFYYANGFEKRIVKFDDDREYTFNLNCLVNKGNLIITILDKNKNILLTLDENITTGIIDVKSKCKYYIKVRFFKCSGNYNLTWK